MHSGSEGDGDRAIARDKAQRKDKATIFIGSSSDVEIIPWDNFGKSERERESESERKAKCVYESRQQLKPRMATESGNGESINKSERVQRGTESSCCLCTTSTEATTTTEN